MTYIFSQSTPSLPLKAFALSCHEFDNVAFAAVTNIRSAKYSDWKGGTGLVPLVQIKLILSIILYSTLNGDDDEGLS